MYGNCELHLSDVKSEWRWSDSRIGLKNVAHLSGLIGRCPDKMCDKLYMEKLSISEVILIAYSYIRDNTQHNLKLMIVHVNRHETKILFVPNIQFMFSCLHVDLDIPYC